MSMSGVVARPGKLADTSNVSIVARTVRTCMSVVTASCASNLTVGTIGLMFRGLPSTCRGKTGSPGTHRRVTGTSYVTNVTFTGTFLNIGRSVTRGLNTFRRLPRNITGTMVLARIVECGTTRIPAGVKAFSRCRCPRTLTECTRLKHFTKYANGSSGRMFRGFVTGLRRLGRGVKVGGAVGSCNVSRGCFLSALSRVSRRTFGSRYAKTGPECPLVRRVGSLCLGYCCKGWVTLRGRTCSH